jgi:hypothetical protein
MQNRPTNKKAVLLDGHSARSAAAVGRVSAPGASGVTTRGAGARHTAGAVSCLDAGLLSVLLLFVALIWAFIPVGATGGVNVLAPGQAPAGCTCDTTANCPASSRPVAARSNWISTLRSGKRHALFHVAVRTDSPAGDDTTSNDSDDDDDNDTSHDLSDDGEKEHAFAAFPQAEVLCKTGHDVEGAPVWTETLPSSFPAGQRLRC